MGSPQRNSLLCSPCCRVAVAGGFGRSGLPARCSASSRSRFCASLHNHHHPHLIRADTTPAYRLSQSDTCVEAPFGSSQAGCEAVCGAQPAPSPTPPPALPSPRPESQVEHPKLPPKLVSPETIISLLVGLAVGMIMGAVGAMALRGRCRRNNGTQPSNGLQQGFIN
eukprot:COSAG01_NODE_62_length_29700_cov_146.810615_10_plen_167_part_00